VGGARNEKVGSSAALLWTYLGRIVRGLLGYAGLKGGEWKNDYRTVHGKTSKFLRSGAARVGKRKKERRKVPDDSLTWGTIY